MAGQVVFELTNPACPFWMVLKYTSEPISVTLVMKRADEHYIPVSILHRVRDDMDSDRTASAGQK